MSIKETFLIALIASGVNVLILGLFLWVARMRGLIDAWAYMAGGIVVLFLAMWFLSKEES